MKNKLIFFVLGVGVILAIAASTTPILNGFLDHSNFNGVGYAITNVSFFEATGVPGYYGDGSGMSNVPSSGIQFSNTQSGGSFVTSPNYTFKTTNTILGIYHGTAATPVTSPDATVIIQKVSSNNVQTASNPSLYVTATMLSTNANNNATAVIGEAISGGGNKQSFVEGGRFMGTLTGNAGGTNAAYGAIAQAGTSSSVDYRFLIGMEGVAVNQSGRNAPVSYDVNRFSAAFLATSFAANQPDAAYMVNPFNTSTFRTGFLVPSNSVDNAAFSSYATTVVGLDLSAGVQTFAAIAIPNNTPITARGAGANNAAQFDLIRLSSTTNLILAGGTGSSEWVGIGTSTPAVMLDVVGEIAGGHVGGRNSVHPAISAGSSAGTSPTIALDATASDVGFTATLTTGTSPAANNVIFTITFSAAYATAPHIVESPANFNAAILSGAARPFITSVGTGSFVLTVSTALAAGTQYIWNFVVIR